MRPANVIAHLLPPVELMAPARLKGGEALRLRQEERRAHHLKARLGRAKAHDRELARKLLEARDRRGADERRAEQNAGAAEGRQAKMGRQGPTSQDEPTAKMGSLGQP